MTQQTEANKVKNINCDVCGELVLEKDRVTCADKPYHFYCFNDILLREDVMGSG